MCERLACLLRVAFDGIQLTRRTVNSLPANLGKLASTVDDVHMDSSPSKLNTNANANPTIKQYTFHV